MNIVKDLLNQQLIHTAHHVSKNWTMGNFHFHDGYEINLSVSGGNRFFINNQIYEAKKGDIFLFAPTDLHKNVVPPNLRYDRYTLFIQPQALEELCTEKTNVYKVFERNRISLQSELMIDAVKLFNKMMVYQESNEFGSDVYQKIVLAELLLKLNSLSEIKKEQKEVPSEDFKKIQPVIEYIDNKLSEKILLDDLASRFYISKYYLCEIFKRETGFTINEYMTNKRILKSKDLLLKGIPVSVVSQMVGYKNETHFIRMFKRLVGQTPKQYSKGQNK